MYLLNRCEASRFTACTYDIMSSEKSHKTYCVTFLIWAKERSITMYYLINGSPGKNGNTAQMMKKVAEGIKGAGGEDVITHLYDYQFKGCVSCFGCKLKWKEPGHCLVKDGISGLLEDINHADGIVLGSTLYYSDVSGALCSFLERLYFSHMFYNKENRPAPLNIPCVVIITCIIRRIYINNINSFF